MKAFLQSQCFWYVNDSNKLLFSKNNIFLKHWFGCVLISINSFFPKRPVAKAVYFTIKFNNMSFYKIGGCSFAKPFVMTNRGFNKHLDSQVIHFETITIEFSSDFCEMLKKDLPLLFLLKLPIFKTS